MISLLCILAEIVRNWFLEGGGEYCFAASSYIALTVQDMRIQY